MIELVRDLRVINVIARFENDPWKTMDARVLTGLVCPVINPPICFYTTSSFVHNFKAIGQFKLQLQSWNAQFSSKSVIFCSISCELEIWWIILKNNREPLLYYVKLCASFQSYGWIQVGVTVQNRSIWFKISTFLSPVALKFDELPWKTIGHFFYTTSSYEQHFEAISEFKLEVQSGYTQFTSKLAIFVLWNLEIW